MSDALCPPNIILIVIDDLGWADLACYGSDFYETPHLDALAQRGVRFTDAYAACPVCSPTRASLLTGRYPARVGITNWIGGNPWGKLMGVPFFDALPKHEVTVAQRLKPAGYDCYHVGKWHLGGENHGPEDFGFDVNIAGCHRGSPPSYFSPYELPTLADGPDGEYLTDRLTDEALRLITPHAPQGPRAARPFFLNLWHYAVHTPIQSPPDLITKYRDKAHRLGRHPDDALIPGEAFPCLHKKDHRIARRVVQSDPAYAAMIENLDTNLGRLFDALDQLALRDNTLIVFTSDNGGLATAEGSPTCNAPLREGKGWMTDGGNRVCLIAAGAGVERAGQTCDTPLTSTDLLPTLLDVAGISVPHPPDHAIDGRSFAPALRNQALPDAPIFWHYPHYSNQGDTPAAAVRLGPLKLIEHFEDRRLELYHLPDDPGETRNLADSFPEQTAQLHRLLLDWRSEIEARIPEPNPHYQAMLAGQRPCPDGSGRIPGSDHDAP